MARWSAGTGGAAPCVRRSSSGKRRGRPPSGLPTRSAARSSRDAGPHREDDMAGEVHRIEDQLQRAFEGGAWHGPSVLEVLEGLTAAKTAARPVPGPHSTWEIRLP